MIYWVYHENRKSCEFHGSWDECMQHLERWFYNVEELPPVEEFRRFECERLDGSTDTFVIKM